MKCEYCGAEESLPFVCNYCGGVFCGEHRLPEAHACRGDLTQRRTIVAPPPQESYTEPGYGYTPPRPRPSGHTVSSTEARHIFIAWMALGLAFSITYAVDTGYGVSIIQAGLSFLLSYFAVMLLVVGSGFVLHELSHKFIAQRYGYWAEFRLWPLGVLLALATSFIGFLFAAPGATYIAGTGISDRENAIISVAGPVVNVIVAGLFLPVLLVGLSTGGLLLLLGLEGVYVNIFLGAFNMLPIMPLDGAKVWRWSKLRWAALEVPLILAVFACIIIFGF